MDIAVDDISKDRSFMDVLAVAGGRLVMEKTGKPSEVILPLDKLYVLIETIDILSNPKQAKIIKKSLSEAKEGKIFPIDSILKD